MVDSSNSVLKSKQLLAFAIALQMAVSVQGAGNAVILHKWDSKDCLDAGPACQTC